MPKIHFRLLQTSLLSGLFVLIDLSCFTFYYFILCFILCNTLVVYRYALGSTIFPQKRANILLHFRNAAHKLTHIHLCWEQLLKINSKQSNYGLQNLHYSIKQSEQCLNIYSGSLDIQKSFKKQSKALKIYSTRLLLPIFQGRYCSFINLTPIL